MKIQGRKEVIEAVLIASLSAAATQLCTWALEELKKKKAKKDDEDDTQTRGDRVGG